MRPLVNKNKSLFSWPQVLLHGHFFDHFVVKLNGKDTVQIATFYKIHFLSI